MARERREKVVYFERVPEADTQGGNNKKRRKKEKKKKKMLASKKRRKVILEICTNEEEWVGRKSVHRVFHFTSGTTLDKDCFYAGLILGHAWRSWPELRPRSMACQGRVRHSPSSHSTHPCPMTKATRIHGPSTSHLLCASFLAIGAFPSFRFLLPERPSLYHHHSHHEEVCTIYGDQARTKQATCIFFQSR